MNTTFKSPEFSSSSFLPKKGERNAQLKERVKSCKPPVKTSICRALWIKNDNAYGIIGTLKTVQKDIKINQKHNKKQSKTYRNQQAKIIIGISSKASENKTKGAIGMLGFILRHIRESAPCDHRTHLNP